VISCDDTVPGSTPDDPTPETKNSAPVVDVRAPECVEAESDGPTKVTVTITANDVDRDQMSVVLSGGSSSRTIPTGRYTINGSGEQSITFEVDYQDRGAVFTFTGTADDGQATGSDTATIRVDYPGGCNQSPDSSTPNDSTTDSSTPAKNSAPTVTIATNPSGKVQVCKTGQNTSVPVVITVTTADVDGDRLAILLGKDGGALLNIGSGPGSATDSFTITSADIGRTITFVGRAVEAMRPTVFAEASTSIAVSEKTTGCTVENTAPKVSLSSTNKTWPGCIQQKGSPVSFTVSDTAGTTVSLVIKVGGKVVQEGKKTIPLGSTSASFSYSFTAQQAGLSVSVEAVDDKGASATPLTTNLTKEICPG
jgi:hypothetical protein